MYAFQPPTNARMHLVRRIGHVTYSPSGDNPAFYHSRTFATHFPCKLGDVERLFFLIERVRQKDAARKPFCVGVEACLAPICMPASQFVQHTSKFPPPPDSSSPSPKSSPSNSSATP